MTKAAPVWETPRQMGLRGRGLPCPGTTLEDSAYISRSISEICTYNFLFCTLNRFQICLQLKPVLGIKKFNCTFQYLGEMLLCKEHLVSRLIIG